MTFFIWYLLDWPSVMGLDTSTIFIHSVLYMFHKLHYSSTWIFMSSQPSFISATFSSILFLIYHQSASCQLKFQPISPEGLQHLKPLFSLNTLLRFLNSEIHYVSKLILFNSSSSSLCFQDTSLTLLPHIDNSSYWSHFRERSSSAISQRRLHLISIFSIS